MRGVWLCKYEGGWGRKVSRATLREKDAGEKEAVVGSRKESREAI